MSCDSSAESLPDYARRLDVLHQALAEDFDRIVGLLELKGDEQLVDVGCGDGFFTGLIARRLTTGCVHALDSSSAFLNVVKENLDAAVAKGQLAPIEGDARHLPFESESLDLVWSAHSMQSYEDIPGVLREFQRVLKPEGRLVVLESDSMHSIMLPWPPRLELWLREAERASLGGVEERMGAYFPRYSSRLLREAGFEAIHKHHELIYRAGPLDASLLEYVRLHVENLLKTTETTLPEPVAEQAERFVRAVSDRNAAGGEDLYLSSLQVLTTATPAPRVSG